MRGIIQRVQAVGSYSGGPNDERLISLKITTFKRAHSVPNKKGKKKFITGS